MLTRQAKERRPCSSVAESTLRVGLCIVALLVGVYRTAGQVGAPVAGPSAVRPAPRTGTLQLVRLSDFVGFVGASPLVEDPAGQWKQWLFVYRVDSLKGNLGRGSGTSRYPYIGAGCGDACAYPTRVEGRGEYLVFLHHQLLNGKTQWVATAAFAIEYLPDDAGRIVGVLHGEEDSGRSMPVQQVRGLLRQMVAGKAIGADAERDLNELLTPTAPLSLRTRTPRTFEQRFQQVSAVAGHIRLGTSRADIEKVFPQQDGGISGPSSTRYYAGSEVMVEVPFDQQGGAWRSQNRVMGPLRVYRSWPHMD
jgi:hypothetical protein